MLFQVPYSKGYKVVCPLNSCILESMKTLNSCIFERIFLETSNIKCTWVGHQIIGLQFFSLFFWKLRAARVWSQFEFSSFVGSSLFCAYTRRIFKVLLLKHFCEVSRYSSIFSNVCVAHVDLFWAAHSGFVWCSLVYCSGPQPFWHQGPVLWKRSFLWTGVGGVWFRR